MQNKIKHTYIYKYSTPSLSSLPQPTHTHTLHFSSSSISYLFFIISDFFLPFSARSAVAKVGRTVVAVLPHSFSYSISFLHLFRRVKHFPAALAWFPTADVRLEGRWQSSLVFQASFHHNFIFSPPSLVFRKPSSASHVRADSGEFWTATGGSEAPSCVLELRKLDFCLL